MAALKHDAQGFLQGTPVSIEALMGSAESTGRDVKAIRAYLEGAGARKRAGAGVGQASPQKFNSAAVSAIISDAVKRGAKVAASDGEKVVQRASSDFAKQAKSVVSGGGAESQAAPLQPGASAQPVKRDASGRFEKKDKVQEPGGDGAGAGAGDGAIARLASALKDVGAAEDAEPAIKAFNEVARPLARGYEILGGGSKEKKQERWYRRFWQHMRRDKEDADKHAKLTQRGITALIEKPTGDGKSKRGGLGLLMMGLRALLLGILGKVLPKSMLGAAGLGAAGLGAGGAAGAGGGAGKAAGAAKGAKGLLSRIPILGTALALAGGAAAVWSSESSDATREEKNKSTGAAVGGMAGTVGGMLAGAKLGAAIGVLGGPIGVAIGGAVGGAAGAFFGADAGALLGKTVGGWVTTLQQADIPGKFSSAASAITDGFGRAMEALSAGWGAGIDYLKGVASSAAEWAGNKIDAANEAVRNATGIDVKAVAGNAVQTAKDSASAFASAASNSTLGRGVSAVGSAVKNAWMAKERKSALLKEMDAQGITNKNERAMMLAQVDHESNGFRAGEESFNYSSAERIASVSQSAKKHGTAAIEAARKKGPEAVAELMYGGRMGNTEEGDAFKYRGRGSIQVTGKDNYKALGDKLGLDLVSNPDLLLDPEIGAKASVQWWKDNNVGSAAKAGNVEAATQRINGGQNGIAHRKELYAQYSKDPASTFAGLSADPAPVIAAAPVNAHAPAVRSGAGGASAPIQLAAAPAVPKAVVSNGGGGAQAMTVEPGQDLSDRRLAHVATGGIGGMA